MMKPRRGDVAACARVAYVMASVLMVSMAAYACDTPVYEYAIQNWARDYYQVRYFYSGDEDQADAQVNDYLARAAQRAGGSANLSFSRVDVDSLDPNVSPHHQRAWQRHKSEGLPFYLVASPHGAEVFVGRLDLSAARTMLKSPKRSELAKQLSEGKQGVLLTLLGPSGEDNATATAAVREAVAWAREQSCDIGVMEVSRSDPGEQWLVRQLLSVEDDLKDIARPMVFGAFGRGYVLPPYVGKGITVRNLRDLVAFINGPCACEIKAANPGTDLLTDWNWNAHLAGWAGGTESQPGFVIFNVEEDKEPGAEPVVQMPLLSSTGGGAAAGAKPSTGPAPTTARVVQDETAQEPAESGSPTTAARTTQPRSARADAQPQPAPSPARHEAEAPSQIPTTTTQPEGLKPVGEAPPDEADETSAEPGKSEEARGPDLPTPTVRPDPAAEFEEEQGRSLTSSLSVGLGVTIGTVALFALAGGVFLVRRARES